MFIMHAGYWVKREKRGPAGGPLQEACDLAPSCRQLPGRCELQLADGTQDVLKGWTWGLIVWGPG